MNEQLQIRKLKYRMKKREHPSFSITPFFLDHQTAKTVATGSSPNTNVDAWALSMLLVSFLVNV